MVIKRAPKLKNRKLINIKVTPQERMMIRDAAAAAGISVTEMLRRILKEEAAKLIQAQLEKDKGGQHG